MRRHRGHPRLRDLAAELRADELRQPSGSNRDCIVDIRDYGIWRAKFGQTSGAAARTATPVAAPRPGAATPRPTAAGPPAERRARLGVGRHAVPAAAQALAITFANAIMAQVVEVVA